MRNIHKVASKHLNAIFTAEKFFVITLFSCIASRENEAASVRATEWKKSVCMEQ